MKSSTKKNMDIFYQENKHLLSRTVAEYPINEENFVKWINKYENPDLKSVASLFRKYTRYVSHTEFVGKIGSICAGVRDKSKGFDNVVLMMNSDVKKSNFWVAFLTYHFLNDIITDIVADTLSNFIPENPTNKVLGIICDDASYTGSQISVMMGKIPTTVEVFFVIPYISTIAKKKIKKKAPKNISFSTEIEEFKSFEENLNKENINGLNYRQIKNKYRDIPFGKMTIYFSHKLPDMVSVYQTIYSFGIPFTKNDILKGFDYEPLSLIQNCSPPKGIDTQQLWNLYDLQDTVGIENMCPLPFYKLYKYKFSNVDIYDIRDVLYTHSIKQRDFKEYKNEI